MSSHLRFGPAIRAVPVLALLFSVIAVTGCGSGNRPAPSPPPASANLAITTQPANVTVPLAQPAMFTVVASGGISLTYQWSENGAPISGATGPSYITQPVVGSDSGSVFTVAVSNEDQSIKSDPATLTVGPRSPLPGDLRFQQVGAASTAKGFGAGGICDDVARGWCTVGSGLTTPLVVTESCDKTFDPNIPIPGCLWFFQEHSSSPGVTDISSGALGGDLENMSADLSGSGPLSASIGPLNASNVVINSLGLSPVQDLYALTWVQSSQSSGFDMKQHTVAPEDFAAAAAAEGQQSRVITAASFNAGQVVYFSYGWARDTSTMYETQVSITTLENADSAATNLASQGYILTAIGGDGGLTDTIALVGTRVKGDTLPRPILIVPNEGSVALLQGYAVVGEIRILGSDGLAVLWNTIAER